MKTTACMIQLIAVWTISFMAKGQTYSQKAVGEWGDDRARTIRQTSDGGYIMVGSTFSFGAGASDVYLVKMDASGAVQWSRTYGEADEDEGRGVCETSDGGYAIIGSTYSYGLGDRDIYLLKTDGTGNLQWSKVIGDLGDDFGFIIEQTSDGGFVFTGHTTSYGAGGIDAYLVKTDAAGNIQWGTTIGSGDDDRAFSVIQTSDGGYALAGYTAVIYGAGLSDAYLMKTDASGVVQWTKTFGNVTEDQAYSIAQVDDGGYVLAGFANEDIYVIRTEADGDLVWAKTYGGAGDDVGNEVQQTSDGGFMITGYQSSFGAGGYDSYLLKTDANGEPLFFFSYGGAGEEFGISGQQVTDNSFVMGGFTDSFGSGSNDAYLIFAAPSGNTNDCNQLVIDAGIVETSFTTLVSTGYEENSGFTSFDPVTLVNSPATIETNECLPLPVHFIALNADCSGEGIHLSWTARTSGESDFFTIEKSEDGMLFHSLASIEAIQEKEEYTFTDQYSEGYYRIKYTGSDGSESFTKTIYRSCSQQEIFVQMVEENILISIPAGGNNRAELVLYSACGQLVYQKTFTSSERTQPIAISTHGLKPSVYILRVTTGKEMKNFKIHKH